MNLLKLVENDVCYGVPAHSTQLVDLTLKEIVEAGKVTNPYQLFILGRVAGFFKHGLKSVDLHFENPVNYGDESTSSAVKETLKSMSDVEHVQLASYLLDCITAGECALHDTGMLTADWIKYVLKAQD